ncbi:sialidase family protein [Flexithrix dorotheae]|uniref:sialidase family protein n=1 Tax=Flexithrix dorotheae TaxID=70993 RepID=UPI0003738033|nr:sialidase family protein [Flexithrix dorotheae]
MTAIPFRFSFQILAILGIIPFFISCTKNEQHALAETSSIEKSVLWEKGKGNYNNYRIPSIIVTKKGTVLAFCEGREAGDSGDIDILMKSSKDNGKTWSESKVVWGDAQNSCGNPCPVVDQETGRILLVVTWNNGKDDEGEIINKTSSAPRKPYLLYSDDDGENWSAPVDISATTREDSWGWYATGPGVGIQIKDGKYKGRLVIPANHSYDDPEGNLRGGPYAYGAHVLYSDDHGKNWTKSASIQPGCNESQVTALSDGTLLMNMRSYNDQYSRAISTSTDGGETWSAIQHDYQLVESKVQASILEYGDFEGRNLHLFVNPAVPKGRTHLTLKASFDDCKTWTNSKLVYAGPSAYSCLTRLPNGNVGLFLEHGEKSPYEYMTFISFDPKEIFSTGALMD